MSKLKIADVAKALGWSEAYTRLCAQDGSLPFIHARKTNGRYRYTVYPEKFREYVGGTV